MALLTAAEPDATHWADKAASAAGSSPSSSCNLLHGAMGMVATALLQARRRFAALAVAPPVNNVAVICAYLLFAALRGGEPPSLSLSALELAALAGAPRSAWWRSRVPGRGRGPRVHWRPNVRRDPAWPAWPATSVGGGYLGLTQP